MARLLLTCLRNCGVSFARVAHRNTVSCGRRFSSISESIAGAGQASPVAPPHAPASTAAWPQGRQQPILLYPDPALRYKCTPVTDFGSAEVHQLISDLLTTVQDDGRGIGLAAPQIGGKYRIFVVRKPKYRNEHEFKAAQQRLRRKGPIALAAATHAPSEEFIPVINPTIINHSEASELSIESCLSIPDYSGLVRRAPRIEVTYFDREGKQVHEKLHSAPAFVFQHELDHLDGMLITDREVTHTKRPIDEEMDLAQERWHLSLMKYYGGDDLR